MTAIASPSAARSPAPSGARRRHRKFQLAKLSYPTQFAAMIALLLVVAAGQWALEGPLSGVSWGLPVVAGVGCGALVLAVGLWWRELYLYLAGATASVVVLTLVGAFTAVGTVVVQNAGAEEFAARWGAFAAVLEFLGWDDVFHSWAFVFLLTLVGVMSTVTVIRRRKTMLRWRHLGLLLTHCSVVLLLIGGGIGVLSGSKGMMHLEVGRTAAMYQPRPTPDAPNPAAVPVDFSVRLDGFELDEYEPEFKAYTYLVKADGEYDVLAAEEPKVGAMIGQAGPDADVRVEVKRVLKRAHRGKGYRAAPPGKTGDTALELRLLARGRELADTWLTLARPAVEGPKKRFEVRLLAKMPSPAEVEQLAAGKPPTLERLILLVADPPQRMAVVRGRVIERAPLLAGQPFSPLDNDPERLQLAVGKPVLNAVAWSGWIDRKEGPLSPALEVAITRGGKTITRMLPAKGSQPLRLTADRVLVFREKPNKVRNYESTVSILKAGAVVHTQLVKVNHPLSWGGYHFYQSNYDPDNPRYSGLEVVRDPGLPLVNLAFWLLMYGVLHTVMLRRWTPWWERDDKRRVDDGKPGVSAGNREVTA